jgi:uncharacterized protein YcbK (DUF882 family)
MTYLTEHFETEEFECPCCGINYKISALQSLARALEIMRSEINSPIIITSGRRCVEHNAELDNSVPNSQHVIGCACDIYSPNISITRLACVAYLAGFRYIGMGDDYLHVDMRDFGNAGAGAIWRY